MKFVLPFVVLLFSLLPLFAQEDMNRDEVLITVPNASCNEAMRVAPTPIRFYHRLSDSYMGGTSRSTFSTLKKRGIETIIVDDQPWTHAYAIVAKPHPQKADVSLSEISERVLLRGDDFILVKGSVQSFEELRRRGFVCVEVERVEIPVDVSRTVLPLETAHRNLGVIRGVVDTLIGFVSDTSIRNYIQAMQNFGTRYWNNANRDSVSRWVRAQYLNAGIEGSKLDSFQYSSTWQANIVATMNGTVDATKELIVGGHHDCTSSPTTNSPGADDNATGTAAAIEMARVLKLKNYQPAYTMRFMGFAAEEAGLRGSASYAQRARAANRDIRAMLNYDMIGNRTQSSSDRDVNVVWYTGSEALSNLHVAAAQIYTTITPILSTSSRSGSDSYSFWQQNYKSVFLIERDFSPYYHTSNDLLQYLDMPYCRDIVRSGLATLITLDQMPPQVPRMQLRDCGDGNSLFANWDSVSVLDFAFYKIYVGRIHGIYDTSYTQTNRTCRIAGLTNGQNYVVGVSIVDIAGREGMITELAATPRSVPQAPAGLAFQWTGNSAQLRWRKNGEMDLRGYNIYRRMLPSTNFVKFNVNPIADTTFSDNTISDATRRYFVTAIDSLNNESSSSDTLTVFPPLDVTGRSVSPFQFQLHQNYPNPFNPTTQIKYEVATRGEVELKVFDVVGREVATLVNETKSAGIYVAVWNASEMASGVYLLRLRSGERTAFVRTILLK